MSNPEKHKFDNLFWLTTKDGNKRLATINADPGNKVYTERLLNEEGVEYRTFDPYKSKLGAAIFKKLKTFPLNKGSKILYLGAASGTTVSHVSDIVGDEGLIFAVEFSARSMRDLIVVAERRKNIIPLHADARFPEEYSNTVSQVDIVYEDVAQPFQAEILDTNVKTYLKDGGYYFLAVKSRSIDVTKDPKIIYKEVIDKLESFGLKVIETIDLEPYEKDHIMIVGQK
ncbi:MAG: Fibrillarin-like rRNA/tRNA 2'-O-methyltransferase [Candidatus Heimdallarchaeota archaeon AB_125]|nr:MAG: Fibrillarin-like rRNA/tRNA 2'-O-methyltransferase [Candidatus Heimdallarchaeota archaeon AB_125]